MENEKTTNTRSGIDDLAQQVRETISLLHDCSQQMKEAQAALTECFKRRDSAENMLKNLKFQREENGIWTHTEL